MSNRPQPMPDESPDASMREHLRDSPCKTCGRAALVGCVSAWLPSWNVLIVRGCEYRYAMPCVNNAPPFPDATPTPPPTRKRTRP